jgi:sugar lactone lactonase YvrE
VGSGAGVPAVGGGSVWVPVTDAGELVRVDEATGKVLGRTRVGKPAGGPGFLDSATFAESSVWSASDAGGTIARVDGGSGTRAQTFSVGPRPGGVVSGGGFVWAFGFLGGSVTRIDPGSGAVRTSQLNASATGIAYGGDAVWILSTNPARILEVDPASGSVRATVSLRLPSPAVYSVIDTWSLAYGDGAVWASLPNAGAVARLDVATHKVAYARTPYGRPFGVAVGGGSAWVATDHGVLRLDESTGKPTGVALLPAAVGSGFVSIAFSDGAAWFTNYDRGTLTRVSG